MLQHEQPPRAVSRGARPGTTPSRATVARDMLSLQTVAGNAAVKVLVQRMGPALKNVKEPFVANDTPGYAAPAPTASGAHVRVWWPRRTVTQEQYRYFCHGLTLDTYRQFGYSVFSGRDVAQVLNDEHQDLGRQWNGLKSGDIVAWREGRDVIHTATVINLPENDRTAKNVLLWTKNGSHAEVAGMSISDVSRIYGQDFSFWR